MILIEPSSVNLRALLTRFRTIWRSLAESPMAIFGTDASIWDSIVRERCRALLLRRKTQLLMQSLGGEGNGFDFNFARFDFREVENIVDQGH